MTDQGTIAEQKNDSVTEPVVQDVREGAHPHAFKRIGWGIIALCGVLALVGIWSRWGEEIKEACTGGGDTGACVIEYDDPPSMEDVRFEQPPRNALEE